MNKLREHIAGNKILYRMIVGYTVMSTIIILVMTSFMYNAFRSGIEKEIYRYQVQSLRQISNTVGFRAEYANFLMQQMKQEKEIMRLFYNSDDVNGVTALDKMTKMRISVKQLHSIYVYNENKNIIYCAGENTFSSISNFYTFQDQGFIEIIDNIDQYAKFTPFLRMVSMEGPDGQVHNTYVYTYVLYDTFSSGKISNIMAFNFHLGWMEDALDFITRGKSTSEQIKIVNTNREIVYSDSGELIGTAITNQQELPDEVFENESGYVIIGNGDNRQMLVYATPDQSGYEEWTFLSWSDYSSMIEPLTRVRVIVNLIFVLGLLFSAVVIVLLSGHIYKPVKQTFDKVESLEIEQEKKLKIDRMLFLRKLFMGNEEDNLQKIKENFDKYDIEYELDEDNCVLLLSVDYATSFLRKYSKDLEKVDNYMLELFTEEFQAAYKNVIVVKIQDGIWGICVPVSKETADDTENGDEWEKGKKRMADLFDSINQKLEERLQITISIAVSEHGYSVRDIPYLYSEAINIHSYRYLLGQNRIIDMEDIRAQEQSKFEYPSEVEKKLLSCLYSGKAAETTKAYEEFVDIVRGFPVGEVKLSFMLLAYAIKNASNNTTAEVSSILMEFDQFYKKMQMLETIDEVNQMFLHLIGEIVEKLQMYALKHHEKLINKMKEYVSNNYGQISLSMNEVSDYVDMSAAYLGRLFKQVTGITFTEYLTKFRLNTACNLLKNTDKTVNEISDEVGFTNSSYFYIVFKKNLGCTPNQYRKQQVDEIQ